MSSWLTGNGGGLQTTAWRSWNCTSGRALSGLVSWWMILVARANLPLVGFHFFVRRQDDRVARGSSATRWRPSA